MDAGMILFPVDSLSPSSQNRVPVMYGGSFSAPSGYSRMVMPPNLMRQNAQPLVPSMLNRSLVAVLTEVNVLLIFSPPFVPLKNSCFAVHFWPT